MKNGWKWVKMVYIGARLRYNQIQFKLKSIKKQLKFNSNQNKQKLKEPEQNKSNRNKFGFPIIKP
jgi:hypothetical protein